MTGLFLCLALVPVLCGLYWVWDYYMPRHGYFADYTERWLMPEGLGPLTREQVGRRFDHYRFEWRKRKLRRIVHANSAGFPIPHKLAHSLDRPTILDLAYDESEQRLIRRDHLARNGRIVIREVVSEDGRIVDLVSANGHEQGVPLASPAAGSEYGVLAYLPGLRDSEKEQAARSKICRYGIKYDDCGFATEVRYLRAGLDTPICSGDGVFGKRHEMDKDGRVTRVVLLGPDGTPQMDKVGIAAITYLYGPSANVTRVEYQDSQGLMCLNAKGVAAEELGYDPDGNVISMRFVGPDNEPRLCLAGYRETRFSYDEGGNITQQTYHGLEGEPLTDRIWRVHATHAESDERGFLTRFNHFGPDGQPYTSALGFAEARVEQDDKGNLTQSSFFGLDGEPVLERANGAHIIRAEYNSQGNSTRLQCMGPDGAMCVGAMGCAEMRKEYDGRGNLVRVLCLGPDGGPLASIGGYAEERMEYDVKGNRVVWSCYGAKGEPVLDRNEKKHTAKACQDDHGNNTRMSYFGVDGKPCISAHGFAEVRMDYDDMGRMSQCSFFGVNGEPVSDMAGGSHIARFEYDLRGNKTRILHLGVDGKPCVGTEGFAESRAEYNDKGKVTALSYHGPDGSPVFSCYMRVHMTKHDYDRRGNQILTSHFAPSGQLCPDATGICTVQKRFDAADRCIEEWYSDRHGNPARDAYGLHRRCVEYDSRGNEIRAVATGMDGRPVAFMGSAAAREQVYDAFDRVTEVRFFGVDGQPCDIGEGWTRLVIHYDQRGQVASRDEYDTQGRLR